MTHIQVTLSEQNLADFLEADRGDMEKYRAELHHRIINYYGDAEVEIDRNALSDKITTTDVDQEDDTKFVVRHMMGQMTEDWSWLHD